MPHTAYIVDCCRTPGGKKKGSLKDVHALTLGATVVDALVTRTGVDPAQIDDVIFGCVSQIGSQAANVARGIVLESKLLPITVPGTSVDRQCGSSQQAIHFAAQAVMSGTQDCVIAGGVENMSTVPIGSNVMDAMVKGRGLPITPAMQDHYKVRMFSQFEGAEMLAKKYDITREDMDKLGYASHMKAKAATEAGKFKQEIVPIMGKDPKTGEAKLLSVDEGIRGGVTMEKLSSLKLLKKDGTGRVTAGTASQITDGAAALLICNEMGLKKLGLKPRAKIISLALAGSDPVIMLEGPIPATKQAFEKSGLTMKDMDLYEVNEAFASVPLAWVKALGGDLDKLNVNGGAMALGHPLGGTGAKLMTTLVHELERRKGRYGVQAICEGGGTANATIIERVDGNAITSNL